MQRDLWLLHLILLSSKKLIDQHADEQWKFTQQHYSITYLAIARKKYDWGNVHSKILFLDI